MKKKTSLSIDAQLLRRFRELAKRNHRTISGELEAQMERALAAFTQEAAGGKTQPDAAPTTDQT